MVWMAGIAGGIFVVLLLLGRPVGDALFLAFVLSCPLMMVGMMFMMGGSQQPQEDGRAQVTDRLTDRE